MTFIVRVALAEGGRLLGVVERVKTGRKERVDDLDSIGRVIAAAMGIGPDIGSSPEETTNDRGET